MLQTTSKLPTTASNVPSTKADELHDRRKCIAAEITELWTCLTHSLPDKPALCWRAPTPNGQPAGPCYLITLSNVNLWTSLVVRGHNFVYYMDSLVYYRSKIRSDSLQKLNPSRLLHSRMAHIIKAESWIPTNLTCSFSAYLSRR